VKAVVVRSFGPLDQAVVEDVPDPIPGPGEVVVAVEASELNYPDILAIEGRYQFKPPLPFSPGKAAAGRVAALGTGVGGVRVGDRVVAQVEYGAFAERLCAPAAACVPVPEDMSLLDAAALGLTYQTAWFALTQRAAFKAPESVLVLGAAGGLGVAGVQLAKALGSKLVIGATRGSRKVATVKAAGADHVVDVAAPDLRESLRNEIRTITGGKGVDIVLDPVGGALTDAALRTLAWSGRLIVLGFASGDIPTIRANYLLVKNIAVLGLQWSDYRDNAPDLLAQAQRQIFSLHRSGALKPIVSKVLPLSGFRHGLELIRAGEAEGKLMLDLRLEN
jgi:NADPH:quinone reductase